MINDRERLECRVFFLQRRLETLLRKRLGYEYNDRTELSMMLDKLETGSILVRTGPALRQVSATRNKLLHDEHAALQFNDEIVSACVETLNLALEELSDVSPNLPQQLEELQSSFFLRQRTLETKLRIELKLAPDDRTRFWDMLAEEGISKRLGQISVALKANTGLRNDLVHSESAAAAYPPKFISGFIKVINDAIDLLEERGTPQEINKVTKHVWAVPQRLCLALCAIGIAVLFSVYSISRSFVSSENTRAMLRAELAAISPISDVARNRINGEIDGGRYSRASESIKKAQGEVKQNAEDHEQNKAEIERLRGELTNGDSLGIVLAECGAWAGLSEADGRELLKREEQYLRKVEELKNMNDALIRPAPASDVSDSPQVRANFQRRLKQVRETIAEDNDRSKLFAAKKEKEELLSGAYRRLNLQDLRNSTSEMQLTRNMLVDAMERMMFETVTNDAGLVSRVIAVIDNVLVLAEGLCAKVDALKTKPTKTVFTGSLADIDSQYDEVLASFKSLARLHELLLPFITVVQERDQIVSLAMNQEKNIDPFYDSFQEATQCIQTSLEEYLRTGKCDSAALARKFYDLFEKYKNTEHIAVDIGDGVLLDMVRIRPAEQGAVPNASQLTSVSSSYDASHAPFPNPVLRETSQDKEFWIAEYEVTCEQFAIFLDSHGKEGGNGGYITSAERTNTALKQCCEFENAEREDPNKRLGRAKRMKRLVPSTIDMNAWRKSLRKNNRYPVTYVSWNDASEFAKWLNSRLNLSKSSAKVSISNAKYRLPDENECFQAFQVSTNSSFSWDAFLRTHEQYENLGDKNLAAGLDPSDTAALFPNDDGYSSLAPVDAFDKNVWKVKGMLGNVSEFCLSMTPEEDKVKIFGGNFASTTIEEKRLTGINGTLIGRNSCRSTVGFRVVFSPNVSGGTINE